MKTSTFLIAPLFICVSSASLMGGLGGRSNGDTKEAQQPASRQTFAEYLAAAGVPLPAERSIGRRNTRRDRARNQIRQLPPVSMEGSPQPQSQPLGETPVVPKTGETSVQLELPAATTASAAAPSAKPGLPETEQPNLPPKGPVFPTMPNMPGGPGMMPGGPRGPGGPGEFPPMEVFPPGKGDLPGRAPTGPVDEALKVEGSLPPGFSVIGNAPAPSGVQDEPIASAAPTEAISSGAQVEVPLPTNSVQLPASSAPVEIPLPSAPAEGPVASAPAKVPISSAPAELPLPSSPAQVIPVIPGAEEPVAGMPMLGGVDKLVSSVAAKPTASLPDGFSVISSDIPAAAAATAGMHDFDRKGQGSQDSQRNSASAPATTTSAAREATPTSLPDGFEVISENPGPQQTDTAGASSTLIASAPTSTGLPVINAGVVVNLPAGFKIVKAPTTFIKKVRRSMPQSDEELMYRYGSS